MLKQDPHPTEHPEIDDGDFRDLAKDSEKILDGQFDTEGLFIDTGSSVKEGNYLNPDVVGPEEQDKDRFQVVSLLRARIRRLEKKKVGRFLVYLAIFTGLVLIDVALGNRDSDMYPHVPCMLILATAVTIWIYRYLK